MSKTEHSKSLTRAWRWWIGPAAVALALALFFVDPFVGDWDAVDYTVLAVKGQASSMALGRSAFIFFNHLLWRIAQALFGMKPENAYLLFKYAVVAQAPLAVIAAWALAREASGSLHTATLAALLIATSPAFVIYSGQGMTEIPSLLILSTALVIHLRGVEEQRTPLIILGAALLGLGVNVREPVGFFALWLAIAPFACGRGWNRRDVVDTIAALMVFGLIAIGGFALLYLTDINSFRAAWHGWRESMARESARHPITIGNLRPFAAYFILSSPFVALGLSLLLVKRVRHDQSKLLIWLAAAGLFATALLFLNYSTTINWRYFLTGLPALAPFAASLYLSAISRFTRSRLKALGAAVAAIVAITFIAAILIKPIFDKMTIRRVNSRDYIKSLSTLPDDGVVIAGAQTVAINYWHGIGAGNWETIGTGGGWPGNKLTEVIDRNLAAGKPVFLDADPRWWSPCGWQKSETEAIAALEQHYRFRRLNGTIYQLRPLTDLTAQDVPNLSTLLPENRPTDRAQCLTGN